MKIQMAATLFSHFDSGIVEARDAILMASPNEDVMCEVEGWAASVSFLRLAACVLFFMLSSLDILC